MMATAEQAQEKPVSMAIVVIRSPLVAWEFIRRWPVIPGAVIVLFGLATIFTTQFATDDPNDQNLRASFAPPMWNDEYYENNDRIDRRYIFGADQHGRDIYSRMVHGTRVSITVAAAAAVIGMTLGLWAGIASGWFAGWFDEIMTRFVDVWNGLPFLLIALVVSITIGTGLMVLIGLLVMATWVGLVRNIRAEVLSLKTRDYVASARVAGGSDFRIMYRHILPGVINLLMVLASLRIGGLILAEASLSYLGIGVPSRYPSWGNMISDGREFLDTAWWVSVVPGFCIFLVVMSFNFIGDWVRDRTDPRLRQIR
ncbi:MAG: ABC transporter permease [Chloroflexi bacterium]|nr:ABC transporter permease [Chloroflexota bacterium]